MDSEEINLPFPEVIHVAHFNHSTAESPSLNACLSEAEAMDDDKVTFVAEYKLVRTRKLIRKIEEVPF